MNGAAITDDAGVTWSLIDNVGKLYIVFASTTVGWGSQRGTNVVYKYIGNPLPVELTSFTASANDADVILDWSTATELNNYGFEIQRKAFNCDFATVAFVKGQGTTTQQTNTALLKKIWMRENTFTVSGKWITVGSIVTHKQLKLK
jgi:hypothetical protein